MIDGSNSHSEPEPPFQPDEHQSSPEFDPYSEDIEDGEAGEAEAAQLVGQIHDLVAALPELEKDQAVDINGLDILRDDDEIVIDPGEYQGFGIALRIFPTDSEEVIMEDHIAYVMVDTKAEGSPVVFYNIYSTRIRRQFEDSDDQGFGKALRGEGTGIREWAEKATADEAESEAFAQITGTDRVSLATAARLSAIVANCIQRLHSPTER